MINEQVKKIYLSQIFVKIFSGGILLTLISCVLTWIDIEGFAVFFASEIIKLIQNLKVITITIGIVSILWLWIGLLIHEKNIRFVSISSVLVMLVFFYMAYSVSQSENVKENDKIASIIVLIVYGLLYIIPIILSFKNNFKCLYMNINLTLFFLLISQLYILVKFSDSGVKAVGIVLQYYFHIGVLGVLIALVSSIILTIKIKGDVHQKEIIEPENNAIQPDTL